MEGTWLLYSSDTQRHTKRKRKGDRGREGERKQSVCAWQSTLWQGKARFFAFVFSSFFIYSVFSHVLHPGLQFSLPHLPPKSLFLTSSFPQAHPPIILPSENRKSSREINQMQRNKLHNKIRRIFSHQGWMNQPNSRKGSQKAGKRATDSYYSHC